MAGYQAVRIADARRIARECRKDQVIIMAWDRASSRTHVTTYGRTLGDSALAAEGGNFLKRTLGFPEDMCDAMSPRIRKATAERLRKLADEIEAGR